MRARFTQDQRDAMRMLAAASGGEITPHQMVDAARPADSPLHALFEWDDRVAGEKYREDQARGYLRASDVLVVVDNTPLRVPAYLRNALAEPHEQSYLPIEALRKADDATKRLQLAQEIRYVLAALQRARTIAAYLGMAPELEDLAERVRQFHERTVPGADGPTAPPPQ